uniref:Uncharacterized protein n=1 Tax=Haptolina brevifila TaxID=156173 RepID=A0A7S2JM85_9EUKA
MDTVHLHTDLPNHVAMVSTRGEPNAETQAYLMRELGLWRVGDDQQAAVINATRWLTFSVGQADCPLVRQRGALRSALLMAEVLHRTLVLPRLCLLADSSDATVPFSELFDYGRFAAAFPAHAEAALLRSIPQPAANFHIALSEQSSPKGNITASFRTRSPKGTNEGQLRGWMKKYSTRKLISFDRAFHRLNKLDDLRAQARFDARLRAGLQPAPVLRGVLQELIATLRQGTRGRDGDGRGQGGFNCLQMTRDDVAKNHEKVFVLAARLIGSRRPTLLADVSRSATAQELFGGSFTMPLLLSDLLPPRHRHLFEDDEGRVTLAYDLIETHLCAAADIFAGNLVSGYGQMVCYERNGAFAEPSSMDVDSAEEQPSKVGGVGTGERRPCFDVYSREEEVIKAAKFGRGWF